MGLATKCGKTEKQRMSVEIYDILLAKVYVFPISIYSSSHDDIVKSSHIPTLNEAWNSTRVSFMSLD